MDSLIQELEWGQRSNMSEKKKTLDAYGNEVEICPEDFKLTQNRDKIADEKFKTKTTTFIKDAFKRFCKNKSSVAGACIIGVLLVLAIVVPLCSSYDVTNSTYPEQALLTPKLFETGTGWWDGTTQYTRSVYDYETGEVAGGDFKNEYIVENSRKLSEMETINRAVTGAHGGTLLTLQVANIQDESKFDSAVFGIETGSAITIDPEENLTFTIDFGTVDEDVTSYGDIVLSQYKLYFKSGDEKIYIDEYYVDATGTKTYNLSDQVLFEDDFIVGLEVKPALNNKLGYIGVKSFNFKSDSIDEEHVASVSNFNMTDANAQVLTTNKSEGYWRVNNATKTVYKANIQYLTFRYDDYSSKLGKKDIEITPAKINEWLANGYFEKTNKVEVEGKTGTYNYTVKVLDDKCPLIDGTILQEVNIQKYNTETKQFDEISTFYGSVMYYKYKGYSSMPKFIFGTTALGYDLFTLCFTSLRTSLAVAIIIAAINFTIGLIWGSISGYFGGNVDLIMERITDILSGVPFIVVVTLCILNLGNNVATFAIAMCLTGWIGTAARTRTQFYRFKGREYVLASRTLGARDTRLIFKHILPNSLGTIVTGAVLMIPSVIFSEATLAYLNLGLQGSASFGVLLSDNQQYLYTLPMLIVVPSIIISLLMISFNLFGNGLRDALNPSLKGSD